MPVSRGNTYTQGTRLLVFPLACPSQSELPVTKEPASAVAHWWGVSTNTVGRWRHALGIGWSNPGTVKLRRAGYDDPVRNRKIAAAKRGKPRPPKVREKIRATLKRYYGT